MAKISPRRGVESPDTENSDPQCLHRETKPNLKTFTLPSMSPNSKDARYFSVLPKFGSPPGRHYSLVQTKSRMTQARGISCKSGERPRDRRAYHQGRKLEANQPLQGHILGRKVAESKPAPTTPRVTSVSRSPLCSEERTPEIKVGITPPKSGTPDCRRSLQLDDVIGQLHNSGPEYDYDDDDDDSLVPSMKEAPIHGSCSTPGVNESGNKDVLQAPQVNLAPENPRQRAKVRDAGTAQQFSSQSTSGSRKRRRESYNTNTLADDSTPTPTKKICLESAGKPMLQPTIKTPPQSEPRKLTRSGAQKTAQIPRGNATVQPLSSDSEVDTENSSDFEVPVFRKKQLQKNAGLDMHVPVRQSPKGNHQLAYKKLGARQKYHGSDTKRSKESCPKVAEVPLPTETPPLSAPRRLTRSVARKTAQTPLLSRDNAVQSLSSDSEVDSDSESDFGAPAKSPTESVPRRLTRSVARKTSQTPMISRDNAVQSLPSDSEVDSESESDFEVPAKSPTESVPRRLTRSVARKTAQTPMISRDNTTVQLLSTDSEVDSDKELDFEAPLLIDDPVKTPTESVPRRLTRSAARKITIDTTTVQPLSSGLDVDAESDSDFEVPVFQQQKQPRRLTRSVARKAAKTPMVSRDNTTARPLFSDSEVDTESDSEFEPPEVVEAFLPSDDLEKTPPDSVPRRLTRSVAQKTAQTPMISRDNTTVQLLSTDSEVDTESESDFEAPDIRRKRQRSAATPSASAANRQPVATPRNKTRNHNTAMNAKERKTPLRRRVNGATPRRKDVVPHIPQKTVFAEDSERDPFKIAREK